MEKGVVGRPSVSDETSAVSRSLIKKRKCFSIFWYIGTITTLSTAPHDPRLKGQRCVHQEEEGGEKDCI